MHMGPSQPPSSSPRQPTLPSLYISSPKRAQSMSPSAAAPCEVSGQLLRSRGLVLVAEYCGK